MESVDKVKYVDPSPSVPGGGWAKKHGFVHVRHVSKEDAHIILEPLGLDPHDYSDAFDAVIFGNPWGYLLKFVEAGGDLQRLNIRQKK